MRIIPFRLSPFARMDDVDLKSASVDIFQTVFQIRKSKGLQKVIGSRNYLDLSVNGFYQGAIPSAIRVLRTVPTKAGSG